MILKTLETLCVSVDWTIANHLGRFNSELAMVETYQAKYVSLHVRVSNVAARHLYETTLGFKTEKPEAKYYADGEDALCMRLDFDHIKKQIDAEEEERELAAEAQTNGSKTNGGEHLDEGEAVGEVGRDPEAGKKKKLPVGRSKEESK